MLLKLETFEPRLSRLTYQSLNFVMCTPNMCTPLFKLLQCFYKFNSKFKVYCILKGQPQRQDGLLLARSRKLLHHRMDRNRKKVAKGLTSYEFNLFQLASNIASNKHCCFLCACNGGSSNAHELSKSKSSQKPSC